MVALAIQLTQAFRANNCRVCWSRNDTAAGRHQRGLTQVDVCGIATSIGVESTARQAYELGYNVTLATDAMSCLNAETHHNSIERIFPRLGETGTTEDILALLN